MRLTRPGLEATGPAVTFTFDGRPIPALAGETVASALAADGIAAIRRTGNGPDGSPWRGLYCGMGACFECAVTIDGRIGQRACLAKVAGGEAIRSGPPEATGGDPLAPLAPLPAGSSLPEVTTDVLVVGAGPAGLRAALAARQRGADVVVLDERPESGGQYYKPVAASHGVRRLPDAQFRAGRDLVTAARAAGVDIRQNATVWGAFAADDLVALVDDTATRFRPRRLILATGAYERPAPMPGWTLPGVMTTGAAQTLVRSTQVAPGRRVVIAGNGPLNFQLASDLVARGVRVEAVVESAARPRRAGLESVARALMAGPSLMVEGARYLATLHRNNVPIHWSSIALAAEGVDRVASVRIASIDSEGRPRRGSERVLEADVLCLGYGFAASAEIANALGCRMTLDDRHLGTLAVAATTDCGRTSVEGVFAVGDGARVGGAAVAEAAGALSGLAAADDLGLTSGGANVARWRRRLRRARHFQTALWTLFRAPPIHLALVPDDTTLCRCEDLSFGRIRGEIDGGARSLGVLKRRTRLGMGRCQGRYCSPVAAALLTERLGRPRTPEDAFAPRLPAKPFPAAALAIEKQEWGGHRRAGSPDLSRPVAAVPFGDDSADVVIVGGGVVGACLAYEFARAGCDVVVVERDDTNLQASGANAGSLHVQLLSFDFGDKAEAGGGPAAATLPLGQWAIALWQELSAACGHDFEIRITGGLMVAETAAGMDFLERKATIERQHGIEAEIIGPAELRALAPALSPSLAGAEYVASEGKINPLTATYRVLRQAETLGARIHHSADVRVLHSDGARWRVETSRGTIIADVVVNAAGPWARTVAALAGVDVPVYSAPLQMIVTERAPPLVDQLVAHADRHLSVKQLASGGVVIGGAWPARYRESMRLNVTIRESIEGNLWAATRVLPQLSGLHVLRTWAGMNVNIDGAPIVGEAPGVPGFYNAVTSNGYTLAPAVARLTADLLIRGGCDVDVRPYLLDRFRGPVR